MNCLRCSAPCNMGPVLCDTCAGKALHILPADPRERIQIYQILLKSDNPVTRYAVERLMAEDIDLVEQTMTDPVDRYFNERDA
jgi:hypothetical protein